MTDLSAIPTLTTERLVLRAPRPEDVAPFARFYASDAARFVGGPKDEAMTWRYLAEVIGHWALRGFGRWSVERKDRPGAIGLVGLHEPLDWPEMEVGWYVWDGVGQGYASEAGRAARGHAYGKLGRTTLVSMIAPGNDASVRVAEAMGAQRGEDYRHPRFGTLMLYRHPGPDALRDAA